MINRLMVHLLTLFNALNAVSVYIGGGSSFNDSSSSLLSKLT